MYVGYIIGIKIVLQNKIKNFLQKGFRAEFWRNHSIHHTSFTGD